MFFNYPALQQLIEDIIAQVEDCIAGACSVGFHVICESGGGKSTLVRELIRIAMELYFREDPEKTITPVVGLDGVPSPCTPNGLCTWMLTALQDPFASSRPHMDSAESLTDYTARMFQEGETRIILYDNFQDIPGARRARGIEQIGIRLRDLMDKTNCAWVFLGTKESRSVVNAKSQLLKRIPYKKTLPYFTLSSDEGKKVFLRVLQRIDEWLPLAEPSVDLLVECSGLIFIATDGIFDRVCLLLKNSWPCAVVAGREHLVKADLHEGFRRSFGSDHENPFGAEFVIRRLHGAGELYEHLAEIKAEAETEDKKKAAGAKR